MSDVFSAALDQLGVPAFMADARNNATARQVASEVSPEIRQESPDRLPRLGLLSEAVMLRAASGLAVGEKPSDRDGVKKAASEAFNCWLALASLPDEGAIPAQRLSSTGLACFSVEIPSRRAPADLVFAFRLAVAGLLGDRTAEARLELRRFDLSGAGTNDSDWPVRVETEVLRAICLLARKAGGWDDIDNALRCVQALRGLQAQHEEAYLARSGDNATGAAVDLVGLYHLAQIATLTGQYLTAGDLSVAQLAARLDRHRDRAAEAASLAGSDISQLVGLLWLACREMVSNSIWAHLAGMGDQLQSFARVLTERGRPFPVIELWPSQQKALKSNLLDTYRRAVLVEMPTSAGKTLLAKFSIVQTKALNPSGVIVYVAPTRALVNQVTADLRGDFAQFKWVVEQTVPAFELDPIENRLLSEAPTVLVTTPEKLDLLIRQDHPVTKNVALVIADEAHTLRDTGRGPRLELLLGTIKRDRPNARFLLLSPFLPNDQELAKWLGDGREAAPIVVDWKPSKRVVGIVKGKGRMSNRRLVFQTVEAADNSDVRSGVTFPIGPAPESKNVSDLSHSAVHALLRRGSVLVLCRGQGTATARALEIARSLPDNETSPRVDAVCRYLAAELGDNSSLVACVSKGVAFHHAGLPHETRMLIERLVKYGDVTTVCGTTTLAQGVNFPISSVIVETLKKGEADLSFEDFWNIAGRAGRTLVDRVGVVAFPAGTPAKQETFEEFLRCEAQEITSRLAALLDRVDEIGSNFSTSVLYKWPELSPLLQFLAHAMRVSQVSDLADEVEDLLRASLVYHQAQRARPDGASKLITLCRRYLQQVTKHKNILPLADSTGFATPSVLWLLGHKSQNPALSEPSEWRPTRLFGSDLGPLSDRIRAMADLPEIRLGQGTRAPFNPELVAAILKDWVTGRSVTDMAGEYWRAEESDSEARLANFSRYLFSDLLGKASWGLGALEGICLAGADQEVWNEVGYVPSMVFFGVNRPEAVWLRMVGVPRLVANGLAESWAKDQAPSSFQMIRDWVSGLSDEAWRAVLPSQTNLTPSDMRLVWSELTS